MRNNNENGYVMKKSYLFIVVLFFLLLLGSCLTQSAKFANKPEFSLTRREVNSIDGNYVVAELLLYGKTRMLGTESVTITRNEHANGVIKDPGFITRLNYSNWRFPEYLGVRVNGKSFRIEASAKERDVIGGSNVTETYVYAIDDRLLKLLENAESIILQIGAGSEIIEIPQKGMKYIKSFLRPIK